MELPIQIDKEKVAAFCRKHHLTKLALFGSVLTDRFGPESETEASEEWNDTARRRIAECLREALRWADFVGALSAAEVLVILPECGIDSAHGVIKKVQSALADDSRSQGDENIRAVFAATTWDIGDDPHGMLQGLHRELQAPED